MLALLNFAVDEGLDDRAEEFLGDDVDDLRAHLVQHSLDYCLN